MKGVPDMERPKHLMTPEQGDLVLTLAMLVMAAAVALSFA